MLGRTIGNYEVISTFGEGGMGELYRGRHTRLAREVIIKTIRTEDFSPRQIQHLRERLEREAYIQSQLDNPAIVRVYDFIASGETTCMVMEFVPGRDLRQMIQNETGPIPAPRALKLFKQVLRAVDYAHRFDYADPSGERHRGIIHRDLKPANILVTPDDQVKVTDFGIVKVRGVQGGTQIGFNPGTPEYMSPEQARGRELDQRSDIYSLGIVCYEMLAGRVPFEDDGSGTSDYEIRRGHIELPVTPPSQLYPGVPAALDAVVLRALEKNPDDRYQTAREFLEAIEEYERTGLASAAPRPATAGERKTVIQRDRAGSQKIPAVGTLRGREARDTDPREGHLVTVNEAPVNIGARSQDGPATAGAAAPAKSRLPLLIGAALLVLAALGAYLLWKPSPGSGGTAPPSRQGEAPRVAPAGMVYIAGGEFMMGRNDGGGSEGPAHPMTVKPFYLDKTEVTNEQYEEFVRVTGHPVPRDWVNGTFPAGQANFPVVNVTWNDAAAYARWRNKRLPTEAEWEFAARGRDNLLYPYGNKWDANLSSAKEDGSTQPRAVGSYPAGASPFQALDMAGNVAEWADSDFQPYPGSAQRFAEGFKVVRGGAYNASAAQQTTTSRYGYRPTDATDFIGFRCAQDVK